MKSYSVLQEATDLVDNQLTLIGELFDTKRALTEASSRFVCRCRSFRSYTEQTLAWLARFDKPPPDDPTKPTTRRTRLSPPWKRTPRRLKLGPLINWTWRPR